MDDNKTYITYPSGKKIDIMEVDESLLLDEMVIVDESSDIDIIKNEIKGRIDKLAEYLVEHRGPIKDCMVLISDEPGKLKKVQGPVFEDIENGATREKYIRYGRSVEFI